MKRISILLLSWVLILILLDVGLGEGQYIVCTANQKVGS